jgi:hypothetical protein
LSRIPFEHAFDADVEDVCDLEGCLKRRTVLTRFDSRNRLARHADALGEIALRHPAVFEAEAADMVGDVELLHRSVAASQHHDPGDGGSMGPPEAGVAVQTASAFMEFAMFASP